MRTTPRPKIARCMTSAIAIPSTSSIATEVTVMKTVLKRSVHQRSELSTGVVVVEADEAALVGEAQVDLLQREDDRVADRVGGDGQHRDHRRRAEHPGEAALGAGPLADRGRAVAARAPPSEQPFPLDRVFERSRRSSS